MDRSSCLSFEGQQESGYFVPTVGYVDFLKQTKHMVSLGRTALASFLVESLELSVGAEEVVLRVRPLAICSTRISGVKPHSPTVNTLVTSLEVT